MLFSLVRNISYIVIFDAKNRVIGQVQWREQRGILSPVIFGTLHTGAIKGNSCSNLQGTAAVGFTGFIRPRKSYGLTILNYTVTSNHIHLLVADDGDRGVIPKSIKLVAGRTGQEYNQRKNRKGAFWEDRYHATAVEEGEHLFKVLGLH